MASKIIGGSLRGQRVAALPRGIFARPILARIKKSLFDILKTRITESNFLDLFSGSGSVGLEAASRGAKKVVFIDANPQCQKWIENTLKRLSEKNELFLRQARCEVYRADVLSGLAWLSEEFNIIFSGAPYKDEKKRPLFFVGDVLDIIERDRVLAEGGLFIAQHHNKETIRVPSGWDFYRQEQYGDSVLSFFRQLKYVRKN